jgi:hypothetical protein
VVCATAPLLALTDDEWLILGAVSRPQTSIEQARIRPLNDTVIGADTQRVIIGATVKGVFDARVAGSGQGRTERRTPPG